MKHPRVAILWLVFMVGVFASSASADIDWVTIGDPGNAAQSSLNRSYWPSGGDGYGGVAYTFRISRNETSIAQYAAFLNAKAASDPYDLYSPLMDSDPNISGITRSGSDGSFSYTVTGSGARPIAYVSWFNAARYANWLHNGKGSGDTETGAYSLVDGQTSGTAPAKNVEARIWIPSENEWYKAAYYDPTKGASGGYWSHANRSDRMPSNNFDVAGAANCRADDYATTPGNGTFSANENYLTDVGAYGEDSQSYYGINDMAGNVFEWNDLNAGPGLSRGLRGGGWKGESSVYSDFDQGMRSHARRTRPVDFISSDVGFRVASFYEPSPAVLTVMPTTPVASDGGGLTGSSEDYQINFSTASGEAGSSSDYRLRTGFCGQLVDAVGLHIDEADSGGITLDERASRQLAAGLRYDDDTSSPLAAESIAWSVQSGPLAGISSGGLVTAGSAYQNSSAVVRAAYQAFAESLAIQILNTGNDDFGLYAGDGLSDLWQVGYFGEENENADPASDTDSDGLNNLQEYAFGMNPVQSYGGMLRWSGADLLQSGVPMPFASGTAGSFSFRAVYSRRKDYIAAGLSYTVEFSGDLSTWKASFSTPSVLADDGEIQVVSVPYPFFVNGKKASYFRVKVQSK